jgi:hypothetical protein
MSSFDEYIEVHNAAVRSGNWEPFSRCFTDDAEVRFEEFRSDPSGAATRFARRLRVAPADDEVEVRNVRKRGRADDRRLRLGADRASGRRARSPGTALIRELVITFE